MNNPNPQNTNPQFPQQQKKERGGMSLVKGGVLLLV